MEFSAQDASTCLRRRLFTIAPKNKWKAGSVLSVQRGGPKAAFVALYVKFVQMAHQHEHQLNQMKTILNLEQTPILQNQIQARTIRWTEAGDQPLPDGKFTSPRSVIGTVRGTSAGTDRNRSRGTAMLESNVSRSVVATQMSSAGSLLRRNVCAGNAIAVHSMLSGRRGNRENDRSFHEQCDRPKGSIAALGPIQLSLLALGHRGRYA
jgi:hypothetical protein